MKGAAPIVGGVIFALLLLASVTIDWHNTQGGGSIDLRNRITGARLFAHQIDPYHYKWHSEDPPAYCDPYNNNALDVSKTTATPTGLLLHLPLAEQNYRTAQFVWLGLQWLMLFGTAALWLGLATTNAQRWGVAWFLLAFTYTSDWRLHAERGQIYILFTLLIALWLALTLHPKYRHDFLAGLVAGILAALRPPYALILPFLLVTQRRQLPGWAVGVALGAGLPLLIDPAAWSHYQTGMAGNAAFYTQGFNPNPPPQAYPAMIEGIPIDLLGAFAEIPFADFSLHALLHALGFVPFPALPVLLAGAAAFASWLWFSRARAEETLLPGLIAWLFLIDLFLPAFRDSYNDVLILNLVVLGWIGGRLPVWTLAPCLLAVVIGWYVYAVVPYDNRQINAPAALYTLTAVLALFLFNNRAVPSKVGAAC